MQPHKQKTGNSCVTQICPTKMSHYKAESFPAVISQPLDTLQWLKKTCSYKRHMRVHKSIHRNQTSSHAHAQRFHYSLPDAPPGCSCSLGSMEKEGNRRWKAFQLSVGVGDRAQLTHTENLSSVHVNSGKLIDSAIRWIDRKKCLLKIRNSTRYNC